MSWILMYPESQAEISKIKLDRVSKQAAIYCLRRISRGYADIYDFYSTTMQESL